MNNTEEANTLKPQPGNRKGKSQQIKSTTRGAEFEFEVARVAVLQICESIGFKSFQSSAISTLADISTKFIFQLGKSAHFYANLAGRTDSTALDVIHAMEDMNQPQGFAGASDVINRQISASQRLRDVAVYVRRAKEVPFAWPASRLSAAVERRLEAAPSSARKAETAPPPPAHIPPWLPAFPNPSEDLNPNAARFPTRVSLLKAFAPSIQDLDRDPAEALSVVAKRVKRKTEILAAERNPVQFRIESGKNAASIASVKSRADKVVKSAIQNTQN